MPEPARPLPPAVAIAGCGAVTAVGGTMEELLAGLRQNATGLRRLLRFDQPRFQSCVAGAAPIAATDNPAWTLAHTSLVEARTAAALTLARLPVGRVGFVLSTTKANIQALELLMDNRPCPDAARRHLRPELLAADLAAEHGARGPVQCVSVACVSGLIALQLGAKLIQRGDADAVLVTGVDCLSEFVVAGFSALKALDPAGCRPFDRDRCGLSPGEAAATIVLARADLADRPAALLRGWGVSNDANHLTGPSRDGSGLAQAIQAALQSSALRPEDVDFVHAHGTGTAYNDATESLALRSVFGDACPPVSGSKGMLGHTLGAAGVVEACICILAMRERFLPGIPGLRVAAEGAPASLVREPRNTSRIKHALKLNTGFGGINGAMVLSAFEP
jgi:3-oxoacyl-(acyl-carrier-protein) synthase